MTSADTEQQNPGLAAATECMIEGATILVADDSSDDIELLKRAIHKAGLTNPVQHVSDGHAAIEYLQDHANHEAGHSWPLLMFLDINMPRCTGFGVLSWLRQQPSFEHLPTIVLSNSEQPSDIENSFRLGAHGYWVKPCRFEELVQLMLRLKAMLCSAAKKVDSESTLPVAA